VLSAREIRFYPLFRINGSDARDYSQKVRDTSNPDEPLLPRPRQTYESGSNVEMAKIRPEQLSIFWTAGSYGEDRIV
jgi:hypothetical protein